MYRIILFSFTSLFLFSHCTPKTTASIPTESNPEKVSEVKEETEAPLNSGEAVMQISFRKSSCYGNCPSYEARFYSDGVIKYNGIRNVDNMGFYKSEGHQNLIKRLLKKAEEIRFFDLADFYPTDAPAIPDLPSTFTFVNHKGKEKKIQNNYDGPSTLFELQNLIVEQLTTIKWQADTEWKD